MKPGALKQEPCAVPLEITEPELVQLIRKIQGAQGSEDKADADIELLCDRVADPDALNYIFQLDLTAEEVAEKILAFKPIVLE